MCSGCSGDYEYDDTPEDEQEFIKPRGGVMKLFNIEASNWSEFSKEIAVVGTSIDKVQYHIWVNRDTLKPIDDVLHKNTLTLKAHEHQSLKQYAQCNREIVKQLLHEAASAIAGAKFKHEQEQERTRLEHEENQRKQRVKDAAETMLAALKECQQFDEESGFQEVAFGNWGPRWRQVEAAIALAEPVPVSDKPTFEGNDLTVKELAQAGQTIEAIKLHRKLHDVGLKEAVDYVRSIQGKESF